MKCPFRKITKTHTAGDYVTTKEEFDECYRYDCMCFYMGNGGQRCKMLDVVENKKESKK